MIKFLPLDFFGNHIEFYERVKMLLTVCKYLHWFLRYLSWKMSEIYK